MKVIYQQCAEGLDANPRSIPHRPHVHYTKHGREVVCRGWFPAVSTNWGGLIHYFTEH